MKVSVWCGAIVVKDPSVLRHMVPDVPSDAVFRFAEYGIGTSKLALPGSAGTAFPVLRLHFSYDPTNTELGTRVFEIVPGGYIADLPDASEYRWTFLEPSTDRGQPPHPIQLWEIL